MVGAATALFSTQSRPALASPDRARHLWQAPRRSTAQRLQQSSAGGALDIGAEWCAFCHTIDREILSHPSIQQLTQRIALVKIDVTAMDHGNKLLLQHLRADGPPTLFVVETATGREYPGTRSVGAFEVVDLIRRLSCSGNEDQDRSKGRAGSNKRRGCNGHCRSYVTNAPFVATTARVGRGAPAPDDVSARGEDSGGRDSEYPSVMVCGNRQR
ncbi:MAG: thioredoxin family protein [Proteobacteria bacterium]|nr:thioredoxin family protein [Pseudomonadota bacterium]